MADKLVHKLDYELLKEWGFMWGERVGSSVNSYYCDKPNIYHSKSPIWIANRFDGTWDIYWALPKKIDKDTSIIFRGPIPNSDYLKLVLDACIIEKPQQGGKH